MVSWLTSIQDDAKEIYLVGDVFDFWFEYKTAVPRGFVRLLGKIAELTDRGIIVHFFTGNHDMWTFDYLEKELGVIVYRKPIEVDYSGKKFFIGHGDGLGPGETGYKILKGFFLANCVNGHLLVYILILVLVSPIYGREEVEFQMLDTMKFFMAKKKKDSLLFAKKNCKKNTSTTSFLDIVT